MTIIDSAFGAASLVRDLQPAAVVLDIGLPFRPGTDLLSDLKADEKESYESGFIKSHDNLLDAFVESIDELCDEWAISDAGIAFINMFGKKQYVPFL